MYRLSRLENLVDNQAEELRFLKMKYDDKTEILFRLMQKNKIERHLLRTKRSDKMINPDPFAPIWSTQNKGTL